MIPWVAGMLIGAWAVGRGKPHSQVQKRQMVGNRSGIVYEADDFVESGILIVRPLDGSAVVVLVRAPGGLNFFRGKGNPQTVRFIVQDITGKFLP